MNWTAMLALGAYHGINPGMGWLFAVALGMQAASMRGVWRALPPIALGHAIAVGLVLALAGLVQLAIAPETMRIVVACCLASLGGYRLWRHRHPRFGGMRVGFRDLTIWSFLMASAHGAGLMLVPFVMTRSSDVLAAGHAHAQHAGAAPTSLLAATLAMTTHTMAYLVVMTLVAWVVYQKLGLALLRTAWFNLDWLWAGALVVTGLVVLVA